MYSSISPPPPPPPPPPSLSFNPQTFSFGSIDYMNFTSMPMLHIHNYLTTPPIPPTTANKQMLSSPKATPTKEYPRSNFGGKKQSTQKKDRNCKIVTAHGLRDRRVRLSIDIARQFFDLQDLLGFDRASETLDWLLTKSRTAIKELQTKQIFVENGKPLNLENVVADNNNSTFRTKKRLVQSSHEVENKEDNYSVQESRAKKRSAETQTPHDPKPFGLNPMKPVYQLGHCRTCESELLCFCQISGLAESVETFEDLGVITKKMKPSTVTFRRPGDELYHPQQIL